jgi:hypothetical protein
MQLHSPLSLSQRYPSICAAALAAIIPLLVLMNSACAMHTAEADVKARLRMATQSADPSTPTPLDENGPSAPPPTTSAVPRGAPRTVDEFFNSLTGILADKEDKHRIVLTIPAEIEVSPTDGHPGNQPTPIHIKDQLGIYRRDRQGYHLLDVGGAVAQQSAVGSSSASQGTRVLEFPVKAADDQIFIAVSLSRGGPRRAGADYPGFIGFNEVDARIGRASRILLRGIGPIKKVNELLSKHVTAELLPRRSGTVDTISTLVEGQEERRPSVPTYLLRARTDTVVSGFRMTR